MKEITQSGSEQLRCRRQNATRRLAVEEIMHDHSRIQLDIDDVTDVSLSVYLFTTHEKSLTRNLPGAFAPGIITVKFIKRLTIFFTFTFKFYNIFISNRWRRLSNNLRGSIPFVKL